MSDKKDEAPQDNNQPDEEFDESEKCCTLRFQISLEETEAMQWLQKTLIRIADKSDHPNAKKAEAAMDVIGRLFLLADRTHSLGHIQRHLTEMLLNLDLRLPFDIGEDGPEGVVPVKVTPDKFRELLRTLGIDDEPPKKDPSEMN